MSFEGYYQKICGQGHSWHCDAYSDFNICPYCGEIAIWSNMVDVTNGSWDDEGERIDGYVEPEVLEERKNGKFVEKIVQELATKFGVSTRLVHDVVYRGYRVKKDE